MVNDGNPWVFPIPSMVNPSFSNPDGKEKSGSANPFPRSYTSADRRRAGPPRAEPGAKSWSEQLNWGVSLS